MSGGWVPDDELKAYRRDFLQRMPVGAPDRAPQDPPKAPRASGGECDLLATLGARPRRGPVSPDEMVHDWEPV